jgi:hypothetical protein
MTTAEHDVLHSSFPLEHHHELGRLLHMRALLARGHRHVVQRELERHAPDSVLPERSVVLRTIAGKHQRHVIAEVDDALVLLETWRADAHVVVSADDEQSAVAVGEEIAARVPAMVDERRIEVVFSDRGSGSRTVALDVLPWEEVGDHYPDAVRSALDALVQHRPSAGTARRLVLWHGEPGTGKTSAVRALLHAWREWAGAVVVTDPDSLLQDGRYLRRTVLEADDDDDERWTVLVLEDAEALLRKETGGAAMGKLLNLSDGLLGQGLRCLFLITTNEQLGRIHPAVVRPGRCLAQVEFGRLPAAQAARLLGRPVAVPMTLAEVMAERPVEAVAEDVAVGQYL